jgi:polysaccharide deacetylase family protein (PEP-CTERM system associated)
MTRPKNGDAPSGASFGALTIDVEEHFHVHAFAGTIDRADWPRLPSRVEANTDRILQIFSDTGVKGTFFTLGCVAEAHPALVRRIVDAGHELASHGTAHRAVFDQDRAAFFDDVHRARLVLEDTGGVAVKGYRAPSFSIDERSSWAYDALAEAGYTYSSSSHPISHDNYGDPDAPRHPFREPTANMLEIPITTLLWRGRRIPAGGGGFFRMFPLALTRANMVRMHREGIPPNFYLHPWEVDPSQPRVKAAPLKSRLRHYIGLSRCESKLRRLASRAPSGESSGGQWTRMDEAYHGWLHDLSDTRNAGRLTA